METIVSENGLQVVFINPDLSIQQGRKTNPLFRSMDGADMQLQGDLGVGNHGGKKERMGVTAFFTVHPDDREYNYRISELDPARVSPMTDQAPGMSASAGNECQIKGINRIIIKILRNMVVIFCFNCYHNHAHGVA